MSQHWIEWIHEFYTSASCADAVVMLKLDSVVATNG